ncbi:MAG: hypothetical protein VX453_02565 [Acidobacteriota bacterium]|nr:hypothetical protein [Acidobacteriota bacterium]
MRRPSGRVVRIYVDANIPAGLVVFMRRELAWDVLLAASDSRRRTHYRLAPHWGRTLLSFDRDYLDERRFP